MGVISNDRNRMPDTEKTDSQLWLAVQKDDYAAFEKLFYKYYSSLCVYAEGFVGSKAQAEDVVQDMFTYFWENRNNTDIKTSVSSCFFVAVRHRSLRVLENQMRLRRHYPQLAEYIENLLTSDYSVDEQDIERVRTVMQELPPQCLKVFIMSTLEEKKYAEIANELSISVNTVKSHITKAYKLIRQQIGNKQSLPVLLVLAYLADAGFAPLFMPQLKK